MKLNYEYRADARKALEGHWNEAAVASIVLLFIIAVCCGLNVGSEYAGSGFFKTFIGTSGSLLQFLIGVPVSAGFSIMMLGFMRQTNEITIDEMIEPLRQNYRNILVTLLIMTVQVSLASVFTLGILGIYLGLCYAMVPFLLKDYPELEWRDILRTSREMMNGHKWDFFCLQLSFIGWICLAILTCGVGLIWLQPYITATEAAFYNDLKAETITEVADDQVQEAEVVE